jgi:uncharacterized protein
MSRISTLWHLQTIDQEIDDKTKRARAVGEMLANDPQVAAARAARETAQKTLNQARASLRDRELDAAGLDAKVKQVEERLYGGRVSNPKELDGLEKDLQMHKRRRSEMDDTLLTLMDAVDNAQKQADEKTQALQQLEETRAGDVAHFTREKESLAKRLAELDAQRALARAALGADTVRQYDSLRRTKAGRAVSQVKNASCGMCGVAVPTGLLNRVRTGDEIVICSGCGRMLAS